VIRPLLQLATRIGHWRVPALGGAVGLFLTGSCSSDPPCERSDLCVLPAISLGAQGGERDASIADPMLGGAVGNGGQGGDAAGAAGHDTVTFAGEPSLGGAFSEGYDPRACRQLCLPLVVSDEFRPPGAGEDSSPACSRARGAVGDCFALQWPAGATTVTWQAQKLGAKCFEGAERVHFQARVDGIGQGMRFSVADGVQTKAVWLTRVWAGYDIDVSGLDHERFDFPDTSEPQGLVAFSATLLQPLPATSTVYVDDVRWLPSSASESACPRVGAPGFF
jgi:hypothetical protein